LVTGAISYQWSTGATSSAIFVSPATTTNYTVVGTDANGCSNTATANVLVNATPTVTVNSPTVCVGRSAVLTATGGTTYTWNTGATTPSVSVSPPSTTSYSVTATDANGCKGVGTGTVRVVTNALVTAKVFLEGPYNTTTHMMNDGLRSNNLLPTTEPYAGLASFAHVGGGGNETTTAAVLGVSGANAVVDWVFLELRDQTSSVVYTRSALLQADGDIVDVDGVSPVSFTTAPIGNYYLGVRHRNHLAVVSATPIDFSLLPTIDFKDKNSNVSTSKMNDVDNLKVMRGGDITGNGTINTNDILPVRLANTSGQAPAYKVEDVSMNGVVNTTDILLSRLNNKAN
jgi:hypothetical protein